MLYKKKEEEKKPHIDLDELIPPMRYEGPHRRSVDVASYYGFHLVPPLRVDKEDRAAVDSTSFPPDRVALLRYYLEQGLDACRQPVQLAFTTKVPYQPEVHLHLEVIGSENGTAEALLMHTAHAILRELGFEDLEVDINSVGGPDSFEPFIEKLTEHYRDHLNNLHADCREAFKEHPLKPLQCTSDECAHIRQSAPQSIAFLTEQSRKHLSEVIEFLEEFEIPYKMQPHLVRDHTFTNRTIFRIKTGGDNGEERILAEGERYDNLSKKAGFSRSIPAAGVSLVVCGKRSPSKIDETYQKYKINPNGNPLAYLVQLGPDAKRYSLRISEHLRKSDIPLYFSFSDAKLKDQLNVASQLEVPVVLIVGYKEVLENTVLVRNQETRSQDPIPWRELPHHLKRHHL